MYRLLLIALLPLVQGINLQVESPSSIKDAASTIADDMMTFYTGDEPGQIPGLLPGSLNCDPGVEDNYCWWQAGAMWGALINYWQYTGDDSHNADIQQSILHQRGPLDNFNPPNHSSSMGVDDQAFWAFSALDAVEANFPEVDGAPSWLSLAQGLYNFQMNLWDPLTCGGGFRWQVVPLNNGYNLKNMISNGGNFQIAARLAYITGNESYAAWATTVWDWMADSEMFERFDGILYVWDNLDADHDCTGEEAVQRLIWSYNYGVLLGGAAYMYNYTDGDPEWLNRVEELLESAFQLYFPLEYGGNLMVEFHCEENGICNQDQKSFKAYLSRWMAATALLVPTTYDRIMPKLRESAIGAARQCNGGASGNMCSAQWWRDVPTGKTGVGEQMSALAVIGSNLINPSMAPLSHASGAQSESNPDSGIQNGPNIGTPKPVTTGDKVGAAILTILLIAFTIGGTYWLLFD